ncbi:hypothetical protein N657DRAFT_568394 [Parathielavia appendiculata]|uniref:Uncharacterized protein n=1 Tax=Parathielavia appendiculata TaxID=2587402 RepID=A0AAN6U4B9_9PEZI|nr:hypothetical protein N657DRAFT_568394 [Parathielavia appendiculata]
MRERPSTSSGPSFSKSAGSRFNFDKRLSKDDMALAGQMGAGKAKGLQPNSNGTKVPWVRSAEPSPQRSRMASPSPIITPAAILPTPQSSVSGKIQIGMALGSPTQDSTQNAGSPYVDRPLAGWQPRSQPSIHTSTVPSPLQTPEPLVRRTKTQKRRLFGSLFGGRKNTEPPKPVEASELSRSNSSIPKENPALARSSTVASRKTPKHTPIIIKPTIELSGPVAQDSSWQGPSESVPSVSNSGVGFLNVDIPDIRLERYSVMFSGVLNPNGTKSSLLERRQATLKKLKTLSDKIETEEVKEKTRPRRATSPQPTKSPAFSLFPQTPTRQSGMVGSSGAVMALTTSLAPARGLTRSNTSPAYLPSPSRASLEPPPHGSPDQAKKDRKTVTIVSPRTMDEFHRTAQVEKLRELQRSHIQTGGSFHFHPNESSLILDSPVSDSSPSSSEDEDEDEVDYTTHRLRQLPASLRPSLPEPQWEIITPPSSTSASTNPGSIQPTHANTSIAPTASSTSTTTTLFRTKRSPSASTATSASLSTSSSSTLSSRPSLDIGSSTRISVDEQDAALKAAVEISIARQISISRQQRKMLMRPQFGRASGNGLRERSATVGSGTPQQQQQQQQVMVGGVVKGRVTPVMTMIAGDRRSERVVLDVAE